ncbi:beta-N-acetylhexosaminidase [Streptomyces sp. NBC_01264]|uniref:beta-N-acetylhexosaminidase n=1 Tax=Streptomyces sp. NBC_01264 TaxID=2903804 RepID=UPI0022513B51|nr:family 20 glycosylhydrolase [Streptomyces sp. NBC_01264]
MATYCAKHRVVRAASAVALALTTIGYGAGAPAEAAAQPPPAATSPADGTPSVVPSVGTFTPASGQLWTPSRVSADGGTEVVIDASSPGLADEGKLLAQELGLGYGGSAAPEAGDIRLALSPAGQGASPGGQGAPESYKIVVDENGVTVTGADEAGVFYGTRTVKQAVRTTGSLAAGTIEDAPSKPQRGLNLDIARKYFTPGWIEDRLREMADLKLNQLGLHVSDDQGLGIETKQRKYRGMLPDKYLTQVQLADIVKLATSLHISVVPEFDSPGHLGALLKLFPGFQLKDAYGSPVQGAIDISNEKAGALVDGLVEEFLPLFPGSAWHLGGDEYQALVRRNPEKAFPDLAAAAIEQYGAAAKIKDLATGWLNARAKTVTAAGKQPKAWNDGFYAGTLVQADPAIEVEYWTGKEIGARPPEEYLDAGRKVVNLNDAYLYYVLGQPNDFTYPTGQAIYEQWTPSVLRGTAEVENAAQDQDRILGGRLAVWGDLAKAQTEQQVAAGIGMPLAALAQKVWSGAQPSQAWSDFQALVSRASPGSPSPSGPVSGASTAP